MRLDIEHPSISEVNRKGVIGVLNQPECYGLDYFGEEILSGDEVAEFDGATILVSNLQRYLAEVWDFRFKTIE